MASFKELPYVAKIGIVALAVILLAGGVYMTQLDPLLKANQADTLALKSKQAEVAQLTPFKAKLNELNAQSATLKLKIEEQSKIVPEEKEVPAFITLLSGEAAAAGVQIRRYTPKDTTAKEYYVEVPFEIDVDGPYFGVLDFYDRLQKVQRIVNVKNFVVSTLKIGGHPPGRRPYKWTPNETVGTACLVTTYYSSSQSASKGAPAPVKK